MVLVKRKCNAEGKQRISKCAKFELQLLGASCSYFIDLMNNLTQGIKVRAEIYLSFQKIKKTDQTRKKKKQGCEVLNYKSSGSK